MLQQRSCARQQESRLFIGVPPPLHVLQSPHPEPQCRYSLPFFSLSRQNLPSIQSNDWVLTLLPGTYSGLLGRASTPSTGSKVVAINDSAILVFIRRFYTKYSDFEINSANIIIFKRILE